MLCGDRFVSCSGENHTVNIHIYLSIDKDFGALASQ